MVKVCLLFCLDTKWLQPLVDKLATWTQDGMRQE